MGVVELRRFAGQSEPHMPPSSRGPGRGPLKAKTGVRFPLGASKEIQVEHGGVWEGKALPNTSNLLLIERRLINHWGAPHGFGQVGP